LAVADAVAAAAVDSVSRCTPHVLNHATRDDSGNDDEAIYI
jgi:hypothetical protein